MTKAMRGQSLSVWRSNFASNSFMEKAADVKISAAGCAYPLPHPSLTRLLERQSARVFFLMMAMIG